MVISSGDSWDTFTTAIISRLGKPLAGLLMEYEDSQEDGKKVRRIPPKPLKVTIYQQLTIRNERNSY